MGYIDQLKEPSELVVKYSVIAYTTTASTAAQTIIRCVPNVIAHRST